MGLDGAARRPAAPAREARTGVLAAQHGWPTGWSSRRSRADGRAARVTSSPAAAPLSREIAEFFHACGLLILEGYGLTETSRRQLRQPAGAATSSAPSGCRCPGTEVRIAEDGEILIAGPASCAATTTCPSRPPRRSTPDGWFHTGDIGEIDDDGFLRITDRKKDLIKTSGGKYIAPSAIEGKFKAICPFVSQMIVHGEGRNYATALVTSTPTPSRPGPRARVWRPADLQALATGPEVRAELGVAVAELNTRLNRWETIKDFRVLPHDLSVEEGELPRASR